MLVFNRRMKQKEGYPGEYHFRPEVLGSGAFADVYPVSKFGEDYAVKVFRVEAEGDVTRASELRIIDSVLANVRKNGKNIDCSGLIGVHEIGRRSYIMDYFDGVPVSWLLKSGQLTRNVLNFAGYRYASVMADLHSKGMLISDTNWGSVLVGEDDVKVCDLDFIATEKEYATPGFFALAFGVPAYDSIEQHFEQTIVPQSDVEGLALMLDHAYCGDELYPADSMEQCMYRGYLRMVLRHYPDDRVDQLPSSLRDLMKKVLDKKRDDSVTAQDFAKALEKA